MDELFEKLSITSSVETPACSYDIASSTLTRILIKTLEKRNITITDDILEELYTDLEKHAYIKLKKRPKHIKTAKEINHVKVPFKSKIIKALFYFPEKKNYRYIKLNIAPSSIEGAGMGVYALEPIPEGAKSVYSGVPKVEDDTNSFYSWAINPFKKSGEKVDKPPIYYIDATDLRRSNWTRFVNCGTREKDNNMEAEQFYDDIYYVTSRNIKKNEELFIDYGEEYRAAHLNMSDDY